jgi:hypothetical protein
MCRTCGQNITFANHYFYVPDALAFAAFAYSNAIGLSCDNPPAHGPNGQDLSLGSRRKSIIAGLDDVEPAQDLKVSISREPACKCKPHELMVHNSMVDCAWMKWKKETRK